MSVFASADFDNHEQVVFFSDKKTGLKAIIAMHSTVLGPAVGGCRMWDYATDEEALTDVLRLSRGMSYKNALADLGLGGGKSVIIGDSKTQKTPELMRCFGRALNRLGGHYISAEDVGISVEDIEYAGEETKFVAGLNKGEAASGDPSPFTAHGVFSGLRAAVEHRLGAKDLKGIRVNVQGLGHVGYNLCRELNAAGAVLTVTDINTENVERVTSEFGATAVAPDDIIGIEGDVYAPCALGGTLNDENILKLKVPVVAGAANNQLERDFHGEELRRLGILYAPDYVINAGGIINVANEIHGRAVSEEEGMKKVEELYDTLLEIFKAADEAGKPTSEVADQIAEQRIEAARVAKL